MRIGTRTEAACLEVPCSECTMGPFGSLSSAVLASDLAFRRCALTREIDKRLHQAKPVKNSTDDNTNEHGAHAKIEGQLQARAKCWATDVLSRGTPVSNVADMLAILMTSEEGGQGNGKRE